VKVATYNVNGVNGRLEILLRWLAEASPDVVCLQELKAPQEKFPIKAIEAAGYGAVWHGQKSCNGVAILAKGLEPHLTLKGLPSVPDDAHSRYIEAIVDGIVIVSPYLPNGNPYTGPKFDYKLRWLERLQDYASELLELEVSVILAGDSSAGSTTLFRVEVRDAFRNIVNQGWAYALRTLHPNERISTFWDYFRNAYARDAGLRLDPFLLRSEAASRQAKAEVDKHVRGWEHTSDQVPVWIELADEPIKKRRQRK